MLGLEQGGAARGVLIADPQQERLGRDVGERLVLIAPNEIVQPVWVIAGDANQIRADQEAFYRREFR